jgi:hypothetical protein
MHTHTVAESAGGLRPNHTLGSLGRQEQADSRQQTVDSRQQTADSRQQTADSRQQTADSRRTVVDFAGGLGSNDTLGSLGVGRLEQSLAQQK